jgi:hypothetical protein
MGLTTQATVLGIPNERFFPFYGTEHRFHRLHLHGDTGFRNRVVDEHTLQDSRDAIGAVRADRRLCPA